MRAALLAGLVALAAGEFAEIENTVYDCEYDLTEAQCTTCQGAPTSSDSFFDPKPASCGGCSLMAGGRAGLSGRAGGRRALLVCVAVGEREAYLLWLRT